MLQKLINDIYNNSAKLRKTLKKGSIRKRRSMCSKNCKCKANCKKCTVCRKRKRKSRKYKQGG